MQSLPPNLTGQERADLLNRMVAIDQPDVVWWIPSDVAPSEFAARMLVAHWDKIKELSVSGEDFVKKIQTFIKMAAYRIEFRRAYFKYEQG